MDFHHGGFGREGEFAFPLQPVGVGEDSFHDSAGWPFAENLGFERDRNGILDAGIAAIPVFVAGGPEPCDRTLGALRCRNEFIIGDAEFGSARVDKKVITLSVNFQRHTLEWY